MPLDIEPLSPQRRAAMLIVLLLLFGASLGFAQILVNARKAPRPQFVTIIRPPEGMIDPVRTYEAMHDVILSGSGTVNGMPRFFVALAYDNDTPWTPQTAESEAVAIFERVLGQNVERSGPQGVHVEPATLGRMAAYHVEGEFSDGENRLFQMTRMAAVPGRVVAICFSGPGRITDADKAYFENFCNTRVSIRRVATHTQPTRPR